MSEMPEARKKEGNAKHRGYGIGMPHTLYLDLFAEYVLHAFDAVPYLVGSALTSRSPRDVDVRVILGDEEYAAMDFGDPRRPHDSAKWTALTLAFSALGTKLTGLPIDFQIQQRSYANEDDGPRSALFRRSAVRDYAPPAPEDTDG